VSARLGTLLEGLGADLAHGREPCAPGSGAADTPIEELAYDSRAVRPGMLFIALRGAHADGHAHAAAAVEAGAAALLVERRPENLPRPVPVAIVADSRRAMHEVARRFFGDPGRALVLVGVTGTNGKTSTVRMIESVLRAAGWRAGSIGTISVRYPDVEEPASLTTPESVDLQRILARMRAAGARGVALEVSSHALALGRVHGLAFRAAVFTNLTQDHLDYHRDMEDYAASKALLFGPEHLAGTAVLNAADPLSERLARIARSHGQRVLTYARGAGAAADVRTAVERVALAGAELEIELAARRGQGPALRSEAEPSEAAGARRALRLPLPGDFQVENALAAIAAGHALGLDWDAIRRGLETCPPVPGRLERVADGQPIVLVDYAHTPDALERVLSRVRPLAKARVIAVFGCGGDRDRGKRAPMARAACAHADLVIATSDNPRTEDPLAILRDVAAGLSGAHEVIPDRRSAIRRAIELAAPDDVVVIAGKGHEDYQILGRQKFPFDDRIEARAALAARGAAS
jgi:UDP-N-acetylmuramoyl-L-alanyl-D-glutamate--2,6-diaminopimelate ligase